MLNRNWGRLLFCSSLAALNVQHFIKDHLSTGVPSESLVNNSFLLIAFLYKILAVTLTAAIICDHKAKQAARALGFLILLWAGVRHVPFVLQNMEDPGELNSLCMALATASGAFMIADSIRQIPGYHRRIRFFNTIDRKLVQLPFGIPLIIFGLQHLIYADFIASLIPEWIPGRHFFTLLTGIGFIASGVSIAIAWKNRTACVWLARMILLCILFIHIPRIYSTPSNADEWTFLFQACIVGGSAMVMWQSLLVTTAILREESFRQKELIKSPAKLKKYPGLRSRIKVER